MFNLKVVYIYLTVCVYCGSVGHCITGCRPWLAGGGRIWSDHDRCKKPKVGIYEPPRDKTNNVVFEQVRHTPACTATEAG